MKTTFQSEILNIPESIVARECTACNISKHRIVQHCAYPNISENKILLIHEKPTNSSLYEGRVENGVHIPNINSFTGKPQNVLKRVYDYLGINQNYFSNTTLIRCWRNTAQSNIYEIQHEDYLTCRDVHMQKILQVAQPPVLILLTYTTAKYLLNAESMMLNEEYKNISQLVETEQQTIFKIPAYVTHPLETVVLGNCASNITFRRICSQFIKAIKKAATINKDYEEIAAKVTTNYTVNLTKALNINPKDFETKYKEEFELLKKMQNE